MKLIGWGILVIVALTVALAARFLELYLHPESYRIPPYAFLFGTEPSWSQHQLYYQLYFRATPFLLGFLMAYLVMYRDYLLRNAFGRAWSTWFLAVVSSALALASGCLPIHDQYSWFYDFATDRFWLDRKSVV